MPTIVTSPNPTAGSVDTRAADSLSFPFTALPQAMTIYVKFQERGTVHIAGGRIMQIGAAGNTAPRLLIGQQTNAYRGFYETAISSRTSQLAVAPVVGNIVELLLTLTAAGVMQLSQSINGGTVTAATAAAALVLPPAWSGQLLHLNSVGATSPGASAFLDLLIVRGVQDMPTMRRLAGTVPR